MKQIGFLKSGLLALVLAGFLTAGSTASAQFTNGGFEDGTFNGWTRGSGAWNDYSWPIDPAKYFPGGTKYNASLDASAIVTPGDDPMVGSRLNRVYDGKYAVRVNDWINNYQYSVSAIQQTVTNYTDSHIYFQWAAVLQNSHGLTDSDNFTLKLTDDTLGKTIYSVSYSSYSKSSIFSLYNGWYYTNWQVEDIDVSGYTGDTFTLSLLAADCAQGAHGGYAYLDGFRSTPIINGAVPEPSTYGMIGAGALLIGVMLRRRFSRR